MIIKNIVILDTLVLNTDRNSTPIPLQDTSGFAIQSNILGTPTGIVKLQASCDISTPTVWTDVLGSSNTVTAATTVLYNVVDPQYSWVRITYVDSSAGASTATIKAVFIQKD
jgi:hypothetical protein